LPEIVTFVAVVRPALARPAPDAPLVVVLPLIVTSV
jgi:hypothetical protein